MEKREDDVTAFDSDEPPVSSDEDDHYSEVVDSSESFQIDLGKVKFRSASSSQTH
jgi:hypothetical protein